MFHRTINSEISCRGIGVFSGKLINVRLCPADCGKGIYFIRDDVNRDNVINVNNRSEFITDKFNNTISNGINEVMVIEHLLSALWYFKITDIEIHIDANELPMLDGSSGFWVMAIMSVGVKDYDKKKPKKKVVNELKYEEDDLSIYVKPNDFLKITYEIDYDVKTIGNDKFTFDETKDDYLTEISLARTFCIDSHVEAHRKLKKNFNNSDMIIFSDNGFIVGDNKLRYKNEPIRHKILDLIGDIISTGEYICGEFICRKSGHSSNRKILNLMQDNLIDLNE